jgi:Tfp pilus assembly protein PilO
VHTQLTTEPAPNWRLDRRVPVALIAALVLQTGMALVWAGETHARFENLERQVTAQAALNDRTVRLEEKLLALRASMDRIEAKLDRLGGVCVRDEK